MANSKIIRILVVSSLLASTFVFAGAPAAHWGVFDKVTSSCSCRLFSHDAFRAENLNLVQDSGSVLLASNDTVIAEVACHPGGKQITVSAFSTDSAVAEKARNNIRTHIINSRLFDTCP